MSSEKRITRSSSKSEPQTDLNKSTPLSNQEAKPESSKKRGRKKGKKVISHDVKTPTKSPTKTPISSSQKDGRVLRSMSNGKKKSEKQNPKSEERETGTGTVTGTKKLSSGKKRGRKMSKSSELSTLKNRVRNLVSRMGYEQNLIDAYSTDGWKGQSLEKLRPEKELDRAKAQIIKCKLKIRETFKQLEILLSEGKHDNSLFDSKGEIDCDDIFCAKCKQKNATLNNDIILCDGICDRGFHQNCLNPPLLTKDIPPGNEGWLCPACDCKLDCVELLNDSQGIHLTLGDSWEKVFPEAALIANGALQTDPSDLPSDDSDDDDFDPDKITGDLQSNPTGDDQNGSDQSEEDQSEEESTSDDPDLYTESDEEQKVKPNSNIKKGKNSISISSSSNNNNNNNGGINVENLPSEDSEDDDFCEKESEGNSEEDFTSDSDDFCKEIAKKSKSGGGDEIMMNQESSDNEDWSEKKRRERGKALEISSNNSPKPSPSKKSKRRNSFGLDKNKTLKEYFETNQYPSTESKQILAEELGLTRQQVNKWFASARHYAKKAKDSTQDPQNSTGSKKRGKRPKNSTNSTDKITGSNTSLSNSTDKITGNDTPLSIFTDKNAGNNMSLSKCITTTVEPVTPISVVKPDGSPAGAPTSPMEFMASERKKAIMRELRKKKLGR